MKRIELLGLSTIPEIKAGDNLSEMIVAAANSESGGIKEGDLIVVTSKIISKAKNYVFNINEIKPSRKALRLAKITGKDARKIQAILNTGHKILVALPTYTLAKLGIWDYKVLTQYPEVMIEQLKKDPCTLITMDKDGRPYSEAGIDFSNHPSGIMSYAPPDPDNEAKEIRNGIKKLTGVDAAVVVADTEIFISPGSIDVPRGSSGLKLVNDLFSTPERYGKPKFGGIDIIGLEVTCAAALVMGQVSEGVPAVVIRGFDYARSDEQTVANMLATDFKKMRQMLRRIASKTARLHLRI